MRLGSRVHRRLFFIRRVSSIFVLPDSPFAQGYAPLTSDFEAFFTRRLYGRVRDCWNRPTTGVPGDWITVLDRVADDQTWQTSFQYVSYPYNIPINH